jgi:hypothetical protein
VKWCIPVIPILKKLRQEDQKFQASLGYTLRPYLKQQQLQKEFKNGNSRA